MARIGIKTIAEKAGLSPATVSMVLNGRGNEMRISKPTQERVLEVARSLGYRPNIHARRLRQNQGGNAPAVIGLLWPSLYSSEVLVSFFDGLQSAMLQDQANIEVVYKPYHYDKLEQSSDVFEHHLFNGVIVVGASDGDVDFLKGRDYGMPIVLWNRQNDRYSSVCVDDYDTGSKVADLFHARGHTQVGLIESNLVMRPHALRRSGFADGCQKHGMRLTEASIVQEAPTRTGGERAAKRLIERGDLPTALFFSLGTMAPGAYGILERAGVRIPHDVEVLGYGDTAINPLLRPSLSVIDLPVKTMVAKCLGLLVNMINRQIQDNTTLFESSHFCFRESCGGFPE